MFRGHTRPVSIVLLFSADGVADTFIGRVERGRCMESDAEGICVFRGLPLGLSPLRCDARRCEDVRVGCGFGYGLYRLPEVCNTAG